ncbi:MAG: TIGR02391 family protein [Hyphomicrobiales bacterium]
MTSNGNRDEFLSNLVPFVNPLLSPLDNEQQQLVALLEQTYQENHSWPPWQFVEQSMDIRGLNAINIIGSLPVVGRRYGIYGLKYGLTWSHGMVGGIVYQPGDPVGLTVLGRYRAGATDLVNDFLRVLAMACLKLTTFQPDPKNLVTLELTSEEVIAELNRASEQTHPFFAQEIYESLEHEPAMWTSGRSQSQDGTWKWQVSRSIRPYVNVRTIEDYVEVVAKAAEESALQAEQIVPMATSAPHLVVSSLEQLYGAQSFEQSSFAPQVPLLGSAIDAELWEFVRPLVDEGRWEQVARESAAFVETSARRWTGSDRGVLELMSELLAPPKRKDSSDRRTSALRSEQDGWHMLARGFFMAIRNHVVHNSVGTEEELQYGLGALGTASLLIRRIREATSSRLSTDIPRGPTSNLMIGKEVVAEGEPPGAANR